MDVVNILKVQFSRVFASPDLGTVLATTTAVQGVAMYNLNIFTF